MKRNLLFLLGMITVFFSCSETETTQNEPFKLDYLYQLSSNTVQYTFGNTISLNKNLDSLLDKTR